MKQYSWQGLAEIPTLRGKMKRSIAQFTPKSWTKFEWNSTKNFKSYCTCIFVLAMVSILILEHLVHLVPLDLCCGHVLV